MGTGARLLSLGEVQHQLGLSADQVRELVRSGALPVLRILDVWRVETAAVDRLIDLARDRASWSGPGWSPPRTACVSDGDCCGGHACRSRAGGAGGGAGSGAAGRTAGGANGHPEGGPDDVVDGWRDGGGDASAGRAGMRDGEPGPDGGATLRRAAPERRPLTDQQLRVLTLIGEGLPNDEIAYRLSVEVSTVKSHVARLLRRLDLPDRGRLIAHAWRAGLLEPRR
jgi:DNA-binding CsgD family transcriptional regulator